MKYLCPQFFAIHTLTLCMITTVLFLPSHSLAITWQEEKLFPQPDENKALVYIIDFFPDKIAPTAKAHVYVFIDDSLLAATSKGGYALANVEPGRHMLWILGFEPKVLCREVYLAAGHTYYFQVEDVGVLRPPKLYSVPALRRFTTEEAHQLLSTTLHYDVLDDKDKKRAAKYMKRHYPYVRGICPKWPPLEFPDQSDFLDADDVKESIMIPACTEVELRWLETVTSISTTEGASILLEIAEDVHVDDTLVFRAGTMVTGYIDSVQEAKRGQEFGLIRVVVSSLPAIDGTSIPVEFLHYRHGPAQYVQFGKQWRYVNPLIPGGWVISSLRRGQEASYLAGELSTAVVLDDTPVYVASAESKMPETDAPDRPDQTVVVSSTPVTFKPWEHKLPKVLTTIVDSDETLSDANIVSIGGFQLPTPLPALRIAGPGEDRVIEFDAWEVVRFVRMSDIVTVVPFELTAMLESGNKIVAQGELTVEFGINIGETNNDH